MPRNKRKGHFITAGKSRSRCWVLGAQRWASGEMRPTFYLSANSAGVAIVNVLAFLTTGKVPFDRVRRIPLLLWTFQGTKRCVLTGLC